MKRVAFAAGGLLCLLGNGASARGVSPYLPLNIDPVAERQIERVLILADKSVLTRPIAAATLLDALPKACLVDAVLCQDVRRYLARYMRNWGVTEASIEGFASSGSDRSIPNGYGMTTGESWRVSAQGFYQPTDHLLIAAGAVAYEGEVVPQGSLISVGFDRAQLDLGYRGHWLSPFESSSMLIGTQAATMPSITLSNYVPLTRWGFHYEAFGALMAESDSISYLGAPETGRPRLAGVHLSVEPTYGWSLGVNRLLQYGGGRRPSRLSDLFRAFFDPSRYDNALGGAGAVDGQFGNQLASVTSKFLFPGRTPFAVYFEYAGEDTSDLKNYLFGNASLSAGVHFPRLWRRFDLTYEVSEWQNGWYVNAAYGDGLTNKGHVIGHWGADQRQFNDAVGAQTHMIRLGWEPAFGGEFSFRVSTLRNESYSSVAYERAYDGSVSYSRPMGMFDVGAEVLAGRDVFGESVSRVGAFVRWVGERRTAIVPALEESAPADATAHLFVEAGLSMNRVRTEVPANVFDTQTNTGPHVAFGARRGVSDRSDLGARLELDDVDGHTLMSVRAIDYRYRFEGPLALNVFVGASRYDVATPAYGLYYGIGLQWRDLFPGWDVGVDAREALKVARDHVLPTDVQDPIRPDTFYDIRSLSLSVTKRF